MDPAKRDQFAELWSRYFPHVELPLAFYYAQTPHGELVNPPGEHRCFIADLGAARKGRALCFNAASMGCFGGGRYLGFSQDLMPGFEYFLSCGIPGKLEGERYKKSPEIVQAMMEKAPRFVAPAPYLVLKRWDLLEADDDPEVVIFLAPPDVLSGLFTLSGFEESGLNAVIAPFCAGCGAIIQWPYLEQQSDHPRAVLGMFDVSARPWVQKDWLSFAVPMKKFLRMIDDMDQSFLITESWGKVRTRLQPPHPSPKGLSL